jgi:hypothetical protein
MKQGLQPFESPITLRFTGFRLSITLPISAHIEMNFHFPSFQFTEPTTRHLSLRHSHRSGF